MKEIVLSSDPDIWTFICPNCKAIWRAKGECDFLGGWNFNNDDYCPHGCKSYLFFRIRGMRQ